MFGNKVVSVFRATEEDNLTSLSIQCPKCHTLPFLACKYKMKRKRKGPEMVMVIHRARIKKALRTVG